MLLRILTFFLSIFIVLCLNPIPNAQWETGHIDLGNQGDSLFYYLVKAPPEITSPPLVIWLDGGPGCTSAVGIFMHHGPYIYTRANKFEPNALAWNRLADVMYVDNPVGTGYSRAKSFATYCTTETCVAKDFYSFFLHFLEKHPEYKGRALYFTGESYAGHYVPAIARYLLDAHNPDVKVFGCGIGNGMIDLYEQLPHYPEFLLYNGNITYAPYLFFKAMMLVCYVGVKYEPDSFNYACNGARYLMATYAGIKVTTDITWTGNEGIDSGRMFKYLNSTEVRTAFGVPDQYLKSICDGTVYYAMRDDIKLSLRETLGYLLDSGVKVQLWFGDKDYVDNWMAGLHVAHHVPWEGKERFVGEQFAEWKPSGEVHGEMKAFGNLGFIKVYNAGHSIFDRQLKAGYEILRRLLEPVR